MSEKSGRYVGRMQFGERSLDLGERTVVMGILNVTPDSFSDGGDFFDSERAVSRGIELYHSGADILDIGGESTRPGSVGVSAAEQIRRVVPVISALSKKVDAVISIDTASEEVAEAALDAGAHIVNDISGLRGDDGMARLVADRGAGVVIMHMLGTPRDMQESPFYEDVVAEIKKFFCERIEYALSEGISREKIILDVGIGFGKRIRDNLELIERIDEFFEFGLPVLVGHSRKGFLKAIGGGEVAKDRDAATRDISRKLIDKGVHILRLHDVRGI